MRYQRQILGIGWRDWVCNTTVTEATGLPPVSDIIDTRRSALIAHKVRLGERTPAIVRSSSQSVPATSTPHPHPGSDLVEERVTHASSSRCTRVHPSSRSGTVLCSVVMVNRRNVSCQTRDYDDDAA